MENSRGYEGLGDFDLWMAAAGIQLAQRVEHISKFVTLTIEKPGMEKDIRAHRQSGPSIRSIPYSKAFRNQAAF